MPILKQRSECGQHSYLLESFPQPEMAFVDSAAVFANRLAELGLDGKKANFDDKGWTTMAKFAFAPGITTGTIEDADFKAKIGDIILGPNPDAATLQLEPSLRRLWFEAWTMTIGQMRRAVERTDDDAPKKIPKAERESRKQALEDRLGVAFKMEGELEPADALIDRAMQMADDGNVEWIPWSECPRREQELTSSRGRKRWMADGNGIVREKELKDEPKAEVSSGLKISWALQRRGLALDIAGLMSYEVHEAIRERLIKAITDESPDPRYAGPSMSQTLNADRELWRQLQKVARGSLRSTPVGVKRPLDDHVNKVLSSPEFVWTLMPLPKTTSQSSNKQQSKNEDSEVKNLRKQLQEAREEIRRASRASGSSRPQQAAPAKGKGKSSAKKGKGKGAGKSGGIRMPPGLEGGVPTTPQGERICFNYNLRDCPGELCPNGRGLHLCCRPGCFKKHPFLECAR